MPERRDRRQVPAAARGQLPRVRAAAGGASQGRRDLIESSELEHLLRAHAFLQVERPPTLWAVDGELEPFVRILGEMISAGLVRNGGVLAEITLNVANVTVEPLVDSTVPAGDFVALSISGGGDWHPEATWPDATARPFVNADLEAAAGVAGAAYGYTRALAPDRGSVTVFFHRAREEEASCTR